MINSTEIFTVDTVAELKTLQCNVQNTVAILKGAKDGTISIYYFDHASTANDTSKTTKTVVSIDRQQFGRWLKATLA